jgi:DNA polymerase II large subunit
VVLSCSEKKGVIKIFENIKNGWRKNNVSFSMNEFLCKECNKKYRTKALFKQHMRRKHGVTL